MKVIVHVIICIIAILSINVNAQQWFPLGSGLNNIVADAESDGIGNTYVAGSFTNANGVNTNKIAKWNGWNWSAITTTINGSIAAIEIVNPSEIYVCGNFTQIDGVNANYIAKWDGSTWSALGTGLNYWGQDLYHNPTTGELYVCGDFTSAGGVLASYVAKWDGTNWLPLGNGLSYGVRCITGDSNGIIYVGGQFNTTFNYIAKWNGTNWSSMSGGLNGPCYSMDADLNGNLFIGGVFTFAGATATNRTAMWNGNSWQNLGIGVDAWVHSILVSQNGDVYFGGSFNNAGGSPASGIARWDGTTWNNLGAGITVGTFFACNGIAEDASGDIFAAGAFSGAGSITSQHVAKWADICTDIGSVALPIWSNYSPNFSMEYSTYFNGHIIAAASNTIYRWDQQNSVWIQVYSSSSDVNDLFVHSNRLYFGGLTPGYFNSTSILTGTATLFAGINNVYDYDEFNGSVFAGGQFNNYSIEGIALVTNTFTVFPGLNVGKAYSLGKTSSGNLYAYGDFPSNTNLINIDGSFTVTNLPGQIVTNARTNLQKVKLLEFNNELHIAGDFDGILDASSNTVPGTRSYGVLDVVLNTWKSNTGTGLNEFTSDLFYHNNNLYVTGKFNSINGTNIKNAAIYNGSTYKTIGADYNEIQTGFYVANYLNVSDILVLGGILDNGVSNFSIGRCGNISCFADFDDVASCPLTPIQFTSYTFNSGSCNWDFGDGNTSSSCNPIHSYALPGVYNVTLTFSDNAGCVISTSRRAIVCNQDIYLSGTIVPAFYHAKNNVYISGTIGPLQVIDVKAGNQIILLPGSQVLGTLIATIEPCQ